MRFLFVAFLACFVGTSALAKEWVVGKKQNSVSWTAVGFPGFLRINGEGATVEGSLSQVGSKLSGELKVKVDAFKTGMDLRDEHLHDKYLMSKKYAHAVLTLDSFELKEGKSDFKGMLQIKGQKKPVGGEVVISRDGKAMHVKASFVVSIKDFDSIGVPSYLGITVAEKVDVAVDFLANEKQ